MFAWVHELKFKSYWWLVRRWLQLVRTILHFQFYWSYSRVCSSYDRKYYHQRQHSTITNKLCAWRHNMPTPAVRRTHALAQLQPIPYACGAQRALLQIAVGAVNINELMNINDVRESATIFTRPCKLTFDLIIWKWCPSPVWRGLPVCQFCSS